jgi:type II secretory pathway pseudopilin PulG
MKSTKCVECGFVGWSEENCKACGAPLSRRSTNLPPASPVYSANYDSWNQPEGQKKGLAIFALVLGILSFFTFGLLGVGAITGIILAAVAMGRVKREPWKYGGRGMAIAGLVLSITSLVATVPVGIVAAIAIPNLLASRRAANEGSAIRSLKTISSAEIAYQSNFQRFGTLEELAAHELIDPRLATGSKNGYTFIVKLDETNPEGFEVFSVPATYRNTGTRSFYVDETFVIRAGDNYGGPSSKMDEPLDTDTDRFGPMQTRRMDQ